MKRIICFLLSTCFIFGMLPAYAGAADAQSSGKTGRTIYTDEMVANARSNIEKHTWAKELKDTAVDAADTYVENLDKIYGLIPGEGVPRSKQITTRGLPDAYDYMKNTCPPLRGRACRLIPLAYRSDKQPVEDSVSRVRGPLAVKRL